MMLCKISIENELTPRQQQQQLNYRNPDQLYNYDMIICPHVFE